MPENTNIDTLAEFASAYETNLARSVLVEILNSPSILEQDLMDVETQTPTRMDPIKEFLKGNLPQELAEIPKLGCKGLTKYSEMRSFTSVAYACLYSDVSIYMRSTISCARCIKEYVATTFGANLWP